MKMYDVRGRQGTSLEGAQRTTESKLLLCSCRAFPAPIDRSSNVDGALPRGGGGCGCCGAASCGGGGGGGGGGAGAGSGGASRLLLSPEFETPERSAPCCVGAWDCESAADAKGAPAKRRSRLETLRGMPLAPAWEK